MEQYQIMWPPQQTDFQTHLPLKQMYSWSSSSPISTSSCSGQEFDCNSVGMDEIQKTICPICSDNAYNRHFGAICCNSCAAFFRRTINNKRAYVCLQGKNCQVNTCQARHMCKFCRFQRCIRVGLNISTAIQRIPAEKNASFASKSPLKQLVGYQQETFLHRFQAAIEVQQGKSERVIMGQQNPNFVDSMNSVKGEFFVLNEYLKASGFCSLGLTHEQIEDFSRSIFYSWLVFSSVTSTARNCGFKHNEVYFVDESHMKCETNTVLYYHQTCPNLMDPEQCTRIALEMYKDVLTAAQKLHSARLDEDEVASMFQILAFKGAQRLFNEKDEPIKQELNRLFECLREHYESNFDEISVRLGNLILLTDEIESLTRVFKEYILVLELNGYASVLSHLANASTTNTWTYA